MVQDATGKLLDFGRQQMNVATQVQQSKTIQIVDTEAPVFTNVPQDQTINCDDDNPDFETPTVEDNCDNDVALTYTDDTSGNGCNGDVTRTWTATDDCNNTSTAVQTVYIVDTEAPVFTNVPQDQTINCGDDDPDFGTPTVEDNCDNDVTLTYTDDTNGNGCNGEVTRTWTATDDCNNSSTVIQTSIHC